MCADQSLRGAVHRLCIQRLAHMPGAACLDRQRRAAVDDTVAIRTRGAGKPRMPIVRHDLAGQHSNWRRAEQGVERFHQPERRDRLGNVEMRPHRQRMNPRVSPPGSGQRDPLPSNCECSGFQSLLNGRAGQLPLQPHERAAIEFQREGEAGHLSRVPGGIGLPRSNAPVSITGRPAR